MSRVLILGGTRNLGHFTAMRLLETGHSVAVLNRGVTPDELPVEVERIRAARGDVALIRSRIGPRNFDMVVDTTTYNARDATEAVEIFQGRTARYVFISSGQVYLVRLSANRPFVESEYSGPLMSPPRGGTKDRDEWNYGIGKREAEAVFQSAGSEAQFPVTTLRLPMVASERDHYGRVQGYFARLLDGGPILVPDEHGLGLRHVYARDVARLISSLCDSDAGVRMSLNVSANESMSLAEYLDLVGEVCGRTPRVVRVPRAHLEREALLPGCSPFSGNWMSELDSSLSTEVFGDRIEYTSPRDYLPMLYDDYRTRWMADGIVPSGYAQRTRELGFAEMR